MVRNRKIIGRVRQSNFLNSILMEIQTIWLLKLILSHLVTDFVLQPKKWVEKRNKLHFETKYLYLHGLVTAAVSYLFIGWHYWVIALIILISHILIDGWKSYRE